MFLFVLCVVLNNAFADPYGQGNLQLIPCGSTSVRQHWNITGLPKPTTTTIILRRGASGTGTNTDCIDAHPNPGFQPRTWGCSATNPNSNQLWTIESSSSSSSLSSSSSSQFKLVGSSLCLTLTDPSEFSAITMQDCKSFINPHWQQFSYDASTGQISPTANTSLCIDAGSPSNRSCTQPPLNQFPFCNQSYDINTRVADLVGRMSVSEKVLLMSNSNPGLPRLGLPALSYGEALHGVLGGCGKASGNQTGCPTSFPHATVLGSAFNRTLWTLIGNTIGKEARALNNQGVYGNQVAFGLGVTAWAPNVNLFRDPRWGRGQETAGEDPYLCGEYGRHYVAAVEGDDDYVMLGATPKHFLAYDQEGNFGISRGAFNANVSLQDLVEYYLPPWAAVAPIASSVMCAYNGVNGVPSCSNDQFMNQVMRDRYNFDGFFVSDCGAISDPFSSAFALEHHPTLNTSMLNAWKVFNGVTGGCDCNCGSTYPGYGALAVGAGILHEAAVDKALSRILRAFLRLGYLDSNVPFRSLGPSDVDTSYARQLALEAAQQGTILLQNNDTVLPLQNLAQTKIAVVGPHYNATQDLLSNYHGSNTLVNSHSPLQAMQADPRFQVVAFAQGCDVQCNTTSGFQAAINAATKADVTVVVVGLLPSHPSQTVEPRAFEAEGYDRFNISLPGYQESLIQAIHEQTNTTVVVVLVHGGALAIEWTKANIATIVDAHYGGELGGDALVSVLAGDVSPAGRLTTTVYPVSYVRERPTIMDMNLRPQNGVPGITYLYYSGPTLWPFGWGLSYTTFSFVAGTTVLESSTSEWQQAWHEERAKQGQQIASPISYEVNVTNTGSVVSDVVVLGFLSSASPDPEQQPLKELFGFDRVSQLKPGQTVSVRFYMPPSVLAQVNQLGQHEFVPGNYAVRFGDDANGWAEAQLHLTGNKVQV
eukprot:m.99173 g.99173  ORF g.99173 m.99173 type:complete len:931 (+) comp22155_c0_seq2:48-2840(+)